MNAKLTTLLLVLAVVLIGASQGYFIVDQTRQAIVFQFGKPQGDIKGPGLHMKIPFIQNVEYFDRRILSVDPAPEQMVIASSIEGEKLKEDKDGNEIIPITSSAEPIEVDTFARYKISDPLKFKKTLGTIKQANNRLEYIIIETTKNVLGNITLTDLLSQQRSDIMNDITQRVSKKITDDELGIEIVDIRIIRADLTAALRQSTVRRMISQLRERATETRANGDKRALEIRSTAEKERTIIQANAQRDAQIIRGEGDKEAIRINAEAFSADEEFYSFRRTLEAYKKTLSNKDTQLILSPDSDFFRYFGDIKGKGVK